MSIDKTTYHHGNLKSALIHSGIELLKEGGFQAISLRGVARHADVSQSAPYHHFNSKVDLLCELSCIGYAEFLERQLICYKKYKNTDQLFMKTSLALLNYIQENKNLYQLMSGNDIPFNEWSSELKKFRHDVFKTTLNTAENCIHTHGLTINPDKFVLVWVTLIQGISISIIHERVNDLAHSLFPNKKFNNNEVEFVTKHLMSTLVPDC